MADIIFNPDDNSGGYNLTGGGRDSRDSSVGFITALVMKLTGMENEKRASQALLVLAICCFIAAAIVLWISF